MGKRDFESSTGDEKFASEKRLYKGLFSQEKKAITEYLPMEGTVLNIGCGGGRTSKYLQSYTKIEEVSVDIAENQVNFASEHISGPHFAVADGSRLPFEPNTFDAVLFPNNGLDLIHPEERRSECLEEIRRVIKSSGIFIFSTHNPSPFEGGKNPVSVSNTKEVYRYFIKHGRPYYKKSDFPSFSYRISSQHQIKQLNKYDFELLGISVRIPIFRDQAYITSFGILAHLDTMPYYIAKLK